MLTKIRRNSSSIPRPSIPLNSPSKRPTEALLAIGSVIVLLAILLVVSKADSDVFRTSVSATNAEQDASRGDKD